MSLEGFRLNNKANFINPQDLLVEQVYESHDASDASRQEGSKNAEPTLNALDYNGYDFDYKDDFNEDSCSESDEDEFEQKDLHIGAGVFFDIDKGNDDSDCEEEPKKKKFFFFSVNQSVSVDSNLMVSPANRDSHGLFSYTPATGAIQGTSIDNDQLKLLHKIIHPTKGSKNKSNRTVEKYVPFSQYDNDLDKSNNAAAIKTNTKSAIILGLLVLNIVTQISISV